MPRNEPPRPTDTELAILRVLWRLGPSTVREVRDALPDGVGYTTVLKLLQIMTQKRLVRRDESSRAHVYEARVSEDGTQRQLLDHLVARAFEGSAGRLVLRALSQRSASPGELAEIRALVERLEKEGGES